MKKSEEAGEKLLQKERDEAIFPAVVRIHAFEKAVHNLLEYLVLARSYPKQKESLAQALQFPIIVALIAFRPSLAKLFHKIAGGRGRMIRPTKELIPEIVRSEKPNRFGAQQELWIELIVSAWLDYGPLLFIGLDDWMMLFVKQRMGLCATMLCFEQGAEDPSMIHPLVAGHGKVCRAHKKTLKPYKPFSDASPKTIKALGKILSKLPDFSGLEVAMKQGHDNMVVACNKLREEILAPPAR